MGQLDDPSAEEIAGHLGQRADCLRQVSEVAPDTVLDKLRGVQQGRRDWPFQAMVHYRLGHRDEARR
jgi:hypothetical protein